MKITVTSDTLTNLAVDLVVIGTSSLEVETDHPLSALESLLGKEKLKKLLADEGFKAKRGQTFRIHAPESMKARWIAVVGLEGIQGEGEIAFQLAAAAVGACRGQKTVAVFLPGDTPVTVESAAQGALSAAYKYTAHRSTKPEDEGPKAVSLVVKKESAELKKALNTGKILAEAVAFARDLVNAPPNELNPVRMAEIAQKDAKARGYGIEVYGKKELQQLKMELFLAVNKGSAIEPRMIHVVHKPKKKAKTRVVFVGKGLTFDSGGLCIKPADAMIDMKCDMAGAATTLAIVQAAARLDLPVEVHGVIGATENMSGSHAYRPGDVYRSYLGKTVEIINTDAEGRLVLADVLAWAVKELSPDYLVDHATLTGACMVALGNFRAGLFANDDAFAESYLAAADGENFWRLPLDAELRSQLESQVADLKHTGSRFGGTITAALFLKEFVGDAKWIHLDIAGPAFLDRPHGRHPKGGTGFGVATGVRFLRSLSGRA